MANLGIGIGALAEGFTQGVGLREFYDKAQDKKKIRGVTEEATKEAKALRQADIDAGKKAKPLMDYYAQNVVPKVRDAYLEIGDIQAAQGWDQWLQQRETQKGMKHWASSVMNYQMGNVEGFMDELMKAYNTSGYYDDGFEAVGYKIIGKDKNKPEAIEIEFKTPDGKVQKQRFSDSADVYRLGAMALSPEQTYQMGLDYIRTQDEARLNARKAEADYESKINLETHKSNLRIREAQAEALNSGQYDSEKVREADAMANALKQRGYSDEAIAEWYPRMLNLTQMTKSPESQLTDMLKMLNEMNKENLDWMQMTQEQKIAEAKKLQEQIRLQAGDNMKQQPQPSGAGGQGLPMPPVYR